jgi:WD40 repeat protein
VAGAEQTRERQVDANNALLAALQECREVRHFAAAPVAPAANLKNHVSFTSVAVSRNGKRITTVSDRYQWDGYTNQFPRDRELWEQRSVQLRDAHTGAVQLTMHVPGMIIRSVSFSPDGKILAMLADLGTSLQGTKGKMVYLTDWVVRLWDTTTGQELRVLKGHAHRVSTLDFSPDSRLLATGSLDHSVRIWDVATGKPLHVLQPEKFGNFGFGVSLVRFSSDGCRLLTMTDGVHVKEADPQSKQRFSRGDPPVKDIKDVKEVYNFPLSFGFGGPYRGKDKDQSPAQLWDPTTGQLLATLRPPRDRQTLEETTWADFTPDGQEVITGHWQGSINRWRAEDGAHLSRHPGQPAPVENAQVSTDGSRLLIQTTRSEVPVFVLRDLVTGKELGSWESREKPSLVRVRGDGRLLLTVTQGDRDDPLPKDRTVQVRLAETGKILAELRGHSDTVTAAEFLATNPQVVTASLDGTVRVWQIEGTPGCLVLPGRANTLRQARYRPDGRQLATFAAPARLRVWGGFQPVTGEPFTELWDAAGQRTTTLKGLAGLADSAVRDFVLGGIIHAEFSADGSSLLTVSEDWLPTNEPPGFQGGRLFAPVRVWDTSTGKERYALDGLTASVQQASFSPDGRWLLTVSHRVHSEITFGTDKDGTLRLTGQQLGRKSKDPAVRLWDAATGKLVRVLLDDTHDCWSAVWAPNGKRILTAAQPASGIIPVAYPILALWDAATGDLAGRLDRVEGAGRQHLQFSPDGRWVLGLEGNRAFLWDAATGKHRHTLANHTGDVTAAAFSPDSRRLATAANDRLARIWDITTGEELRQLAGHGGKVLSVAWSADDRWVATASEDGTARLWEMATGREWLTLTGHRGPVHMVSFLPDNQAVLTAGADGTARVWPVDPLPPAKESLPRQLTAEERLRFQVPQAR